MSCWLLERFASTTSTTGADDLAAAVCQPATFAAIGRCLLRSQTRRRVRLLYLVSLLVQEPRCVSE